MAAGLEVFLGAVVAGLGSAISSSEEASGPARKAQSTTPTSAMITDPASAKIQTGRPRSSSSSSMSR